MAKKISDELLINELQRFYKEYGRSPKYEDLCNNPQYPSYSSISRRFGWNNALRIAGLDINKGDKITHKDYVNILGNDYTVLETYINLDTNVKIRHNTCKHEWSPSPIHIIYSHSRCPQCAGVAKSSTEIYKQQVYELYGNEYTVLGEYTGNKEDISMRHNTCNHEWSIRPNNFLSNNTKCPNCFGGVARTHEEFVQEVKDQVGDEYIVQGQYVNSGENILMKHVNCNNEYYVRPNDFLNKGERCPKCGTTKGEDRIRKNLFDYKFNFKEQYSISDCRAILPLKFDFGIFSDIDINTLKILIEFDGEQHFRPVRFYGISKERAKENFEKTKEYDKIKNNYCISNNIALIHIPYWEYKNIEIILEDILIFGNMKNKFIINNIQLIAI